MDYCIAILWKQPVGFFQCFEPLVPALAADICITQALIGSHTTPVTIHLGGLLLHLLRFVDSKFVLFVECVQVYLETFGIKELIP